LIVEGLAVAGALALVLKYWKQLKTKITGETSSLYTKGSAFARLAEQDGKIIALKAASKVKLEEAKAIHAAQDEFDKIVG